LFPHPQSEEYDLPYGLRIGHRVLRKVWGVEFTHQFTSTVYPIADKTASAVIGDEGSGHAGSPTNIERVPLSVLGSNPPGCIFTQVQDHYLPGENVSDTLDAMYTYSRQGAEMYYEALSRTVCDTRRL
jgi:hypothetical protein